MAKKGVQAASRLKGGFMPNPGPNQQRRPIPKSGPNQRLQAARARIANRAAQAAMEVVGDYVPHLAPVMAPLAVKQIPKAYRMAKGFVDNNQEFVQDVKDVVGEVFKGSKNNVIAFPGNTSYGLSKAPNPKKVRLNSGIVPNTFTETYMGAVENLCDPLHITCVNLKIPTNSLQFLNGYFLNTVAFDIQNRAQANVGFDILASGGFSSAAILRAMNAAIAGLQYYYWFTSIMAYESDPANKNEGMLRLRQSITPAQLQLITQLGRRIEDTPIPPRIVEWVRFMSMNCYSGDNQGAAMIKVCPNATLLAASTADGNARTLLTAVINEMAIAVNNTVYSIMSRSIPQWRCGALYDVPVSPIYDSNFKTMFVNLPYCVWNGTAAAPQPAVATDNITIPYNTFNNKLDGVAFAMGSIYSSTNSVFLPGIVEATALNQGVTASLTSSRQSWAVVSGTREFYPSDFNAFHTASRQDSQQFPTTFASIQSPHLFGADKCKNVNSVALEQTAENVIDFLFNVDSIPRKGRLNSFNRRANGMI